MQHEINLRYFSEALQRHREAQKLTVRAAAEQLEGISSSTLSRIERGSLPDLDTYLRLCRWLNVEPSHFAIEPAVSDTTSERHLLQTEDIILHLRADKLLNQQTREALITMIEVAYSAARRNILPNESESITSRI